MRRGRRSTTWSSSRSTDRRSGRGARLVSVCQRPEQPQRRGGDRRVSFTKSPPDHGNSSSTRARRGRTRIAPTFRYRSRTWYSDRRSATATAQRRPPRRSRRPAGVCPSPPSVATRRRCHRRAARAFRRCWPPAIARGGHRRSGRSRRYGQTGTPRSPAHVHPPLSPSRWRTGSDPIPTGSHRDPDDGTLHWKQATAALRGQRPPWNRAGRRLSGSDEGGRWETSALRDFWLVTVGYCAREDAISCKDSQLITPFVSALAVRNGLMDWR